MFYPALEEAYQIRLAAFGQLNAETGSSAALLAQVKGLPLALTVMPRKLRLPRNYSTTRSAAAQHNAENKPAELAFYYLQTEDLTHAAAI